MADEHPKLPSAGVTPQCENEGHCGCDIGTRHFWYVSFCQEREKIRAVAPRVLELATVKLSTGRMYLDVAGIAMAVETDPCRDPNFAENRWSTSMLQTAADRINAAVRESVASVPAEQTDLQAPALAPDPGVTPKLFPIMVGRSGHRAYAYIPWSVIEPHEEQAKRNHSQTLARLAERGGLSACEALAVLEDREWRQISVEKDALKQLYAKVEQLRAALGTGLVSIASHRGLA